MKDYNDLTPMQQLVSKALNSYPDYVFVEMVETLGRLKSWQEIVIEKLDDDECVRMLRILLSMFREWNCA